MRTLASPRQSLNGPLLAAVGGERAVEQDGAVVMIAPMAQMFLFGTEIDYEVSLLESGFRFRNPNVADACGCGESIRFKDVEELAAERDGT